QLFPTFPYTTLFRSILLELLFEREVIFDNAVVHEHAAVGALWMRILLRGFAVGGPPCMSESDCAAEAVPGQRLLEIGELPHGAQIGRAHVCTPVTSG